MSPSSTAAPALTAILPTWDTFEAIRRTVSHLRAQTIAGEIELIICAPTADRVRYDPPDIAGLQSVRVLETGEWHASGPARAMAIRMASAPIVAFCEDHCYPFPDWAEALLAAHRESHAAVGPAFYNANPSTTSWADLYIGYGRWLAPGQRRELALLPGHNTSYKRNLLLEFGGDLDRLMEAETMLLWDLRRKGHTLLMEPAVRVLHTNFAHPRVFLTAQWHLGRVFGAVRAEKWHSARRVAYAIASPAIPLIRLGHVSRTVLESRLPIGQFIVSLPMMVSGLIADAAGQACGALFGPGKSVDLLTAYEFHRVEVNRTGRRPHLDLVSSRWREDNPH
jgi:hypothetical protein